MRFPSFGRLLVVLHGIDAVHINALFPTCCFFWNLSGLLTDAMFQKDYPKCIWSSAIAPAFVAL